MDKRPPDNGNAMDLSPCCRSTVMQDVKLSRKTHSEAVKAVCRSDMLHKLPFESTLVGLGIPLCWALEHPHWNSHPYRDYATERNCSDMDDKTISRVRTGSMSLHGMTLLRLPAPNTSELFQLGNLQCREACKPAQQVPQVTGCTPSQDVAVSTACCLDNGSGIGKVVIVALCCVLTPKEMEPFLSFSILPSV